jgi:hypothetical protein
MLQHLMQVLMRTSQGVTADEASAPLATLPTTTGFGASMHPYGASCPTRLQELGPNTTSSRTRSARFPDFVLGNLKSLVRPRFSRGNGPPHGAFIACAAGVPCFVAPWRTQRERGA